MKELGDFVEALLIMATILVGLAIVDMVLRSIQ